MRVSLKNEFDYENKSFNGKTLALGISVGKSYCEGEKLSAMIKRINRDAFGKVIILLGDTLQRHNYHNVKNDDAYKLSLLNGNKWIKENNFRLKDLNMEYDILRWDDAIMHVKYAEYRNKLKYIFDSNNEADMLLQQTCYSFMQRNIRTKSENVISYDKVRKYILEELPVLFFTLRYDDVDYMGYPNIANELFYYIHKIAEKTFPKKGQWLAFRFKK
ncbi:tRNA-dependent cyclodipeptide synthase [Thiotrichales bacterium 19X7-9]|nr:tRNA-dependent cyclodipeptide synthase [Thiotrichales bacterium 19X7-9]